MKGTQTDDAPEPRDNDKVIKNFLDEHCIGGYLLFTYKDDSLKIFSNADNQVYATAMFKAAQDWIAASQSINIAKLTKLLRGK